MKKQKTLFIVIIVLFWFAQYVYVPYQTPYLAAINVTSSFIGLVIGAYGFAQLLLRIPLGVLADWHLNHKLIIVSGSLLAGLASLARLFWQTGTGFLLGNIVSGIASATWLSFMMYFLKINDEASRVETMGILVMANNTGMLLGFIASSVLASKIAITGLCALSTAAGVLAFLLALSLPVVEFQNNAGTDALKNLRRVFKNKTLITCGVLAFIQQGIQMATTMSFTTQIVREIGAPAYSEGLSSIIYMLAAVLFAKLTASKWIAQFTKRQILVASFILLAAYCFLVPLVGSIYLIYLLQVIPGVGTGILFAILNAEAISRVPQNVWSTATGVFQSIYALGMTSLPIFAGQLRAAYSLTTAFWVLGVLALVGGALAVKFWSD